MLSMLSFRRACRLQIFLFPALVLRDQHLSPAIYPLAPPNKLIATKNAKAQDDSRLPGALSGAGGGHRFPDIHQPRISLYSSLGKDCIQKGNVVCGMQFPVSSSVFKQFLFLRLNGDVFSESVTRSPIADSFPMTVDF
ncbi:hypothetical protein B0H17DRAFT_1031820 [Mycena rosella]|uniref:Uncharacterized protein n=1 Tax=Mycena rosella TaxID=1033263 RepID=A0AAD7GYZ9_MYCRO|nr:hypothetical protein B0H17DRAFT_1031820 [Mycena rosella]